MQSGPRGLEPGRDSEFSRPIERKKRYPAPEAERNADVALMLISEDAAERAAALRRVMDRKEVLAELACSAPHADTRLSAVAMLHEAKALCEVARFSHFTDSRSEALRMLSGRKEALVDIACSSLFPDTRRAAVSMMDDESRVEVAVRAQRGDARREAVASMKDVPALLRLIEETPFRSARKEAVGKLRSDAESLSRIAVSSRHKDARKAAIGHLRERISGLGTEVLVEIAALAHDEDARYVALSMLSENAPAMRRVLHKAPHKDMRTAALVLMSEQLGSIDDPAILCEIAMRAPEATAREAAIGKLGADPQALLEIALGARDQDARDSALRRLSAEPEMLRKIRRASSHRDTRRKAHGLLSGSLAGLLRRMLDLSRT